MYSWISSFQGLRRTTGVAITAAGCGRKTRAHDVFNTKEPSQSSDELETMGQKAM